jgi:hypothetical protein
VAMPQPKADAQYAPSSASVTSKMISDFIALACLADGPLSKSKSSRRWLRHSGC